MMIFSGNANKELAAEIAAYLGTSLGSITVARFADGEVNCQVHDNVRGKDVFIIQPTCPPVNEHLMELLLMVSTMRRASAERITCVIPYYGYARQDRKMIARVPISAADVARLLEAMGVDRVVAVDLHCGQIQGFFGPRVPVDNLDAANVGVRYFANKGLVNPVVVSPDAGGVYRCVRGCGPRAPPRARGAEPFSLTHTHAPTPTPALPPPCSAKQFREGLNHLAPNLDAGLAMIIKQRIKAGAIERMDLVGSVDGSDVVIVDDMIDTAGTLCSAAANLKSNGARRVFCFASHGLLSGPAPDRIARSVLEEVVVTNTIPLKASARACEKIVSLSVAKLLAQAISRVHHRQSVSDLFKTAKKEKEA
jgi:ribose-phosphate pyrophosphokinase